MKHTAYLSFLFIILAAVLPACIEDGISTSADSQPVFSADTLKMGTVFTGEGSPTFRFTVRNPHDKGIIVSEIGLEGENAAYYRLNVDGMSGKTFTDVEIRARDSIYVFAEATLPPAGSAEPRTFDADVAFTVNGVKSRVVVSATGQDVINVSSLRIDSDTRWADARPYRVLDSVSVAPGHTLTLAEGTRVLLHDKAKINVGGRLVAEGTAEHPVVLTGDRTGNVAADIPFELMSRQWDGLYFLPSSEGGVMSHTVVSNSTRGVSAEESSLTLVNCVLRNSAASVLSATASRVEAIGCELADAAGAVVSISGGESVFNHCTVANYYLFAAQSEAAVTLRSLADSGPEAMKADFSNCIFYSRGADISPGDLEGTDVRVTRCVLKSAGTDDDNFRDCLWATDPMWNTVREEYIFDYRLKPESPAAEAAYPALTDPRTASDFYGTPRKASLGAYQTAGI